MKRLRSYQDEIVYRIEHLQSKFDVETFGEASFGYYTYPLYRIIAKRNGNESLKKNVLISGLVHGDEPAGGFAVLHFLNQMVDKYIDRFNFFCYPCVNPSGFETDMRINMNYVDLNRDFKELATSQEVGHIINSLKNGPSRYHLSIDMHECDLDGIDPNEDPNKD